jgi:hypothetical protein
VLGYGFLEVRAREALLLIAGDLVKLCPFIDFEQFALGFWHEVLRCVITIGEMIKSKNCSEFNCINNGELSKIASGIYSLLSDFIDRNPSGYPHH